MLKRTVKKIKHYFVEVIKLETTPHSIALGFAIGSFIAIFPTFGLDFFIALLVILIHPKVNKLALFGAILFWNPLVMTPIYLLSYKIGNLLFGSTPTIKFSIVILNQVYDFSKRVLVGQFILGVIISTISYFIVKVIAQLYQKKIK